MEKRTQRREAQMRRAAVSAQAREQASREICRVLTQLPELAGASVIFSYLALPEEASLRCFHEWARAHGISLAFPVTESGGRMEACVPTEPPRWMTDRYGIRCPAAGRLIVPEDIQAVLTPCVAFDAQARRLGYGGGFYDRFFPRCPQALRVGVAFEVQALPELACEPWDFPLHLVVTEQRILRPGKNSACAACEAPKNLV